MATTSPRSPALRKMSSLTSSDAPLIVAPPARGGTPGGNKLNRFFGEDVKVKNKAAFVEKGVDQDDIKFRHPQTTEFPLVLAASFERLVERLTHKKYADMKFQQTFLMTYHSFATPANLFDELLKRFDIVIEPTRTACDDEDDDFDYDNPSPSPRGRRSEDASTGGGASADPSMTIKFRVLATLIKWVDRRKILDDKALLEDKKLRERIEDWAEEVCATARQNPSKEKEILNSATRLVKLLQTQYTDDFKVTYSSTGLAVTSGVSSHSGQSEASEFSIDSLDAFRNATKKERRGHVKGWTHAVADQLTLIDQEHFSAIEPRECLSKNFSKDSEKAPNILRMIKQFNVVSMWVVESILKDSTPEERALRIEEFILVAKHLRKHNNFNGLLQIMSGFENTAILRLKRSWEKVDKDLLATFESLKDLAKYANNFKNLRETLHKIDPPCVPYLGIYLTDLTFIADGNPDTVITPTGDELIHFQKYRLISRVIEEIQQYQHKPYALKKETPLYDQLAAWQPSMTTEAAYTRSLELEPRDGSVATMSRRRSLSAPNIDVISAAAAKAADAERKPSGSMRSLMKAADGLSKIFTLKKKTSLKGRVKASDAFATMSDGESSVPGSPALARSQSVNSHKRTSKMDDRHRSRTVADNIGAVQLPKWDEGNDSETAHTTMEQRKGSDASTTPSIQREDEFGAAGEIPGAVDAAGDTDDVASGGEGDRTPRPRSDGSGGRRHGDSSRFAIVGISQLIQLDSVLSDAEADGDSGRLSDLSDVRNHIRSMRLGDDHGYRRRNSNYDVDEDSLHLRLNDDGSITHSRRGSNISTTSLGESRSRSLSDSDVSRLSYSSSRFGRGAVGADTPEVLDDLLGTLNLTSLRPCLASKGINCVRALASLNAEDLHGLRVGSSDVCETLATAASARLASMETASKTLASVGRHLTDSSSNNSDDDETDACRELSETQL
eukprot:Opistho-2@74154